MTKSRIYDTNLLRLTGATVTKSGESVGFEFSSMWDGVRSRYWSPAGAFDIDATNNKLYINDGADKTITLTAGAYTYATLAAHIQTQLNASSSAWTATYSTTTLRFTLNRSSGTKTLRLSQTTAAVWDTIGYIGATDRTAGTAADEVRIHTSEWVKVDCGAPVAATGLAIFGPAGEPFCLTRSATAGRWSTRPRSHRPSRPRRSLSRPLPWHRWR